MHNKKRIKKLLALCLPLLVVLGVAGAISQGPFLKANDSGPALVSLAINGEEQSDGTFETEDESVNIALTAKERSLLELPYDEHVQITPLDESEQEYAYPQIGQDDFKKEDFVKQFEEANQTEESTSTTDSTEIVEEQTPEVQEHDSSLFSVSENDQKGVFYLTMEKDEVRRFKVTRKSTETKEVVVRNAQDTELVQKLFQFGVTEQELVQPEVPLMEEEVMPEGEGVPEADPAAEQPAVEEAPVSEESVSEENAAVADAIDRGTRAVSKDEPFPVTIDVGKRTGTEADLDKQKGPGYDNSLDDDIVRTWDLVTYNINAGISNVDSKYTSIRVRLDMELTDAWRIDSSGQLRQTAEFVNGSITDNGDGTKKSTRSAWQTVDRTGAGAAQVYFAETLNVLGGVNGDKLKPSFTITIESATTTTGDVVVIDQVIDANVEPKLDSTEVYISAKPLVDVVLEWHPDVKTTFEKATGTSDKPSTMVTNVGAYVQLKPLPGRSDPTLIKGVTYPVGGIEYTIDQKMIYSIRNTTVSRELVIGTDTRPMEVIAYDGLTGWTMPDKKMTDQYAAYQSNFQPVSRQGLKVPVGYTRRTYPPNTSRDILIGVFDTGTLDVKNNSDNTINVKNPDYKPASVGKNKWLLSGDPMGSNEEPFSVVAMQLAFPYEYLEKQTGTGGQISYQLSISSVKYEGIEQDVNTKKNMSWDKSFNGDIHNFSVFMDENKIGLNSLSGKQWSSNGDGRTTQGNKVWGRVMSSFKDIEGATGVIYGRWNANNFTYDNSRTLSNDTSSNGTRILKNYYGVGNPVPNMNLRKFGEIDSCYVWYNTPEEALAKGNIVATKTEYEITDSAGVGRPATFIPLNVSSVLGVQDGEGNPNILLTNAFNFARNADIQTMYYPLENYGNSNYDYTPTTYNKDGTMIDFHKPSPGWGDTLYIAGMTIRPNIYTNEDIYNPQETINWTVDAKVESGSENNHKVQFAVTIPKETLYTSGTAKDYLGNTLPDPLIVENGDGSWTLSWILDYKTASGTYNPKVTFDSSIVLSKLNFVNNLASFSGKVVSEVWLENDDSIRDTSDEKNFRTSTTSMNVTNSGVIVVDKRVDKSYIDAGNKVDPAQVGTTNPTDFTYTISFKNHSTIPMEEVKILDVLPYNGDARGTAFNGDYSIVDVTQLPGNISGTVWYTTNSILPDRDPNGIPLSAGWYRATSYPAGLKNAKAIMVIYDKLPQGEDMSFTIKVRPEDQKPGDIYVNAPSLNSHINQFVQGVPSSVRVVGRDLSGVAWYDDSLDGLIGNKTDPVVPEDFAADIPVKLYRTSLENPDYKNELVEESLTGEKFIDGSGNSLIKTDANGKYTFSNLPEGEYVAEFVIDGKVHKVTKKLVGDDATKNSKADPGSYKTPGYTQLKINELGSVWGQDDSVNHVTDVNVGLIRPGTINLFKYEAGTAVDGNSDGQLSDPEKATGTPLRNAVFDLIKDHGGTGKKLGTATTDADGKLKFDVGSGLTENLFPGDYSLVETKAPSGFELLKKPINVTITQGNQVIQLYQDNDKGTDLPFTGGDNPMIIVLLAAASLLTVGFIGMMLYYRQPKRRRKL
ncbi:hypothetical protein JZO70_08675 [Enterococcus sp. 669A]|uniref:Prealbumin-like fold domain-containing protein n=1 Tax=Candidatus Enterococcus moelleringii TaxID=2815325 RepID=A0ABS3L9E3_9ENTE|nr:prealbumin-like fold domain-containing protein [Enterococcus sp. 669A]MBO1306231.1 hypothetical protein [Enterococcus sp. 669A]